MNNSREVQTLIDSPQDVAPGLKAMTMPEKPLDPVFEQLGLTPFDPDMWDSWSN